MRKSLLKSGPPCDLHEKFVELIALRAKVAKLEKAFESKSQRKAIGKNRKLDCGAGLAQREVPHE